VYHSMASSSIRKDYIRDKQCITTNNGLAAIFLYILSDVSRLVPRSASAVTFSALATNHLTKHRKHKEPHSNRKGYQHLQNHLQKQNHTASPSLSSPVVLLLWPLLLLNRSPIVLLKLLPLPAGLSFSTGLKLPPSILDECLSSRLLRFDRSGRRCEGASTPRRSESATITLSELESGFVSGPGVEIMLAIDERVRLP